ncbi:MAG: hypothetical protein AB1916_13825 [Thermodesulfobacteriota bacterium]
MSADCLILGMAAGYHFGDLRPFVASLAASGFSGRCVLLVSAATRGLEHLAAFGVTAVRFAPPPGLEHLPANALRYFLYLEYLRREKRAFRRILLTDVRDVAFQADPFSFPWPEGLSLALEYGGRTVGACPYTSRWVRQHLGGAVLDKLAGKPVSCSGTTVGSYAAVLDYVVKMIALLLPFTPAAHMAGYDQGVHNQLLHSGVIPDATVYDSAGPILTLGWRKDPPAVAGNGDILNDAGLPAAIVHQYDRHPALLRAVRKRWT